MLLIHQILVRTFVLGACAVALTACGQQGPLYLPPIGADDRPILPKSSLPALSKTPPGAAGSATLPLAPPPSTASSAP